MATAHVRVDERIKLFCGDSRRMALEDESVQCVVTSPPYWRKRKYNIPDIDFADGWKGQFGLEPTVQMYVSHTAEFLSEIWRVLKKDGVVFWNIDDTYASGKGTCYNPGGGEGSFPSYQRRKTAGNYPLDRGNISQLREMGLKPKDLCLVPSRIALMAQEMGWWVRSDIIWYKQDHPRPESVKDRPSRAHEYIWLFTKSARPYWDYEAVSVPSKRPGQKNQFGSRKERRVVYSPEDPNHRGKPSSSQSRHIFRTKATRAARSVLILDNKGHKLNHSATFPESLAKWCILAGSREDDLVLDPFMGIGTTLKAARELGRQGVGYELSTEYFNIAREYTSQLMLNEYNKE